MVYTKKKRRNPRRKSAKRRKARRIVIRRAKSNPRKRRRVKARRNPAGKAIRPRIYKRRSGYYRGPKSSLPARMTLRNPRRKRRAKKSYRRRSYRRNPARFNLMRTIRSAFSRERLMTLASVTGGIVAGFTVKPFISKVLPETVRDNEIMRKVGYGGLHILLGGIIASMAKGKNMRTFGLAVGATGLYDILQQNVPQLNLPEIPTSNFLTDQLLGTSYEFGSKSTLGASYTTGHRPVSPVAGGTGLGSYGAVVPAFMGASYEAPGSETAGLSGTDPYEGISW